MNLKNIFKPKPKRAAVHMQHFSQEYLDKLIAEHKLISATVSQIKTVSFNRYAAVHGHDTVSAAISNLKVRRVELEGQIDVLSDYLNG
jgi:hypothetical protein